MSGRLRPAALLLLGLSGGCSQEAPPPPVERIVLITIDTLRADRLGSYGDPAAHTPTLDALAAAGVRFDQAISPTPITRPSHASILTSLEPPGHGVRGNSVFALAPDIPTVTEHLKRAGYATAAFVGAFVLDAQFGLDRGFDLYDDDVDRASSGSALSYAERPANVVVDGALEWIRTAPERFFLWVHLYDPHADYEPPRAYAALTHDDLYAGEIAFSDAQVGRLLSGIQRRFGAGGTAVVVTSDHGESLGEHDEATHALTVYDATQRVPLILHGPGLPRGTVVEPQVRLIDIAPTLLALAQAPALSEAEGESLLPLVRGEAPEQERVAYLEAIEPQLSLRWSPVLGLRSEGLKYLRAPRRELYDLRADPREITNLAEAEPERVAALDARLEEMLADARAPTANATLDAAARARLVALGYLMPEDDQLEGVEIGVVGGPDPKDHMAELGAMQRAGALIGEGFAERALAILAAIEDPGAHILLLRANAATLAGRYELLAETGRELVAIDASKPDHHYVLGLGLRGIGQPEESAAAFEAALALDERLSAARVGLGLVAQDRGDLAAALEHFAQADAIEDPPSGARLQIALSKLRAGQRDEGEALLRTLDPFFAGQAETIVQIADVEWQRGDYEASIVRLGAGARKRAESQLLWTNYATRLDALGRFEEAVPAWRRLHSFDADDPARQNDLAWGLAVAGKSLAEALHLAQRASTALGETPQTLDTLATVHLARDEFGAALAVAERALPGAPAEIRAHLHYLQAVALAGLGRDAEARNALSLLDRNRESLGLPWRERAAALGRQLGGGGAS